MEQFIGFDCYSTALLWNYCRSKLSKPTITQKRNQNDKKIILYCAIAMCGINGFVKPITTKESETLIKQMNQAIIHRGPDDQGFFCQSNNNFTIGQGQVRLSIIDLTDAGFQPMFYNKDVGAFSEKHHPEVLEQIAEKSVSIVFNGEIYNYQEIR